MKTLLFFLLTIPTGYYSSINHKSGESILASLYSTISSHTNVGYDGLLSKYPYTDVKSNGYIWDVYSSCDFSTSNYNCSYKKVCDCWNREHTTPQSWFTNSLCKSDMFNVYPTDGKVNNQRGNYPYGECAGGTYLDSKATGRLGSSTFAGYSGTVFEPADEFKGDLARSCMYMVACYYQSQLNQSNGSNVYTYANGKSGFTSYAINLFMKWHRQDPISQKEIDRNNAVYTYQKNRNPFIDHPCLAEYIWGEYKNDTIDLSTLDSCFVSPTPTPPVPPKPEGFHLLPVTNVHSNSATLNWTDAQVTNYTINVYEKQISGTAEVILLTDTAGKKAQKEGYTNSDEQSNAIRLGSGKSTGTLIYSNLSFPNGGKIIVRAIRYQSDTNALFSIQVGDTVKSFKASNSLEEYVMVVPKMQGTKNLSISTVNKGQRIYLYDLQAIGGGEIVEYFPVSGYPQNIGNELSHTVTGLEAMTTYYYTVTPEGKASSEEGIFVTEEGWTGTDFVIFPTLDYYVQDGQIILENLPQESSVYIYNAMGRIIPNADTSLPVGIYLVQITSQGQSRVLKIAIR